MKQQTIQTTLKRDWSQYNLYQSEEKLIFLKMLNDAVNTLDIPYEYCGNGRPKIGTEDMLKCCVIKVFNCFSSRRTIPDLHMAKGLGYIDCIPHFNSVSNYMKMSSMTPYLEQLYRLLALPFAGIEQYFAIDATGFGKYNTSWLNSRLEKKKWRSFNKLHIVTGVKTNVIAVAKITEAVEHDVMHFGELLRETAKVFSVKEIYGDKGYLAFYNTKAAEELGTTPYILPKVNTKMAVKKPWKDTEAWDRMVAFWRHHNEEFLRHYHRRSNVESTFSSMKAKFLPYIRSKDPVSQKNEILCKVVCHNASMLIRAIFELDATADFKKLCLKYA